MSQVAEDVPDRESTTGSPSVARSSVRIPWAAFSFSRISGVYVWIAIILLFALWIPDIFLTELTWKNIASSQAVTAILTVGLLFPLAAGVYDLSVGQVLGFSAMFSAYLVNHGFDTGSAVALTLAAGVAVGVINGIVVAGIGINSFIGTLGTGSILLALVGALSNRQQIVGLPTAFADIGQQQLFGIPIPVFYLIVIAIIGWYVLEHSPFGRYLFAIGGSPDAARLAGVRTRALVFVALVVSALAAAFGGIIVTAKLGAGDPGVGPSYLLPAFAAAFLGATQFKRGRFNVGGSLLAVYLLATGVTGLQLAGAQFWITDLFNGTVLLMALGLASMQGRLRLRRRRVDQTSDKGTDAADLAEPEPTGHG
jgi:ribose transport system permease protein